jgi:hypothetical protein
MCSGRTSPSCPLQSFVQLNRSRAIDCNLSQTETLMTDSSHAMIIAVGILVISSAGCGLDMGRLADSQTEFDPRQIASRDTRSEEAPVAMKSIGTVKSYSSFPDQQTLVITGGDLDLAIVGRGFFQVDANGSISYTRGGALSRHVDGYLLLGPHENLMTLQPPVVMPPNGTDVSISPDGRVSCVVDGLVHEVGQIGLYRFPNRNRLLEIQPNLYVESETSGAPQSGIAGQGGFGSLRHRALESGSQIVDPEAVGTVHKVRFAGERSFEVMVPAYSE